MTRTILFTTLLCALLSLASAAYNIKYTGYLDNTCSEVDTRVTGQIFEKKCAPEYVRAHSYGKITFINEQYLTSCDYSDDQCTVQTVCENYNNSVCYGSTSVEFSNQYSWVANGNGGFVITYSSYSDKTCKAVQVSGPIPVDTCSKEFEVAPKSGMITFINDQYLTSCDYSDTQCTQLTVCENYTNSKCYASSVTQFSNVYSWTNTDAGAASSSAAASSDDANTDDDEFAITYTGYNDNTCSKVDADVTGQIFAKKCAPEYRKAPRSGKITFINDEYLTSCDYSDTTCGTLTICENYTRAECYASSTASFSNKYTWTNQGDGTYSIIYTSFSDKTCATQDIQTFIYEGFCAEEFRAAPQSGMITFINEDYLTSCDYSDTKCEKLILCENYTNSKCYGSEVTSFSNKYSWTRSNRSAASSLTLSLTLLSAALALTLAML